MRQTHRFRIPLRGMIASAACAWAVAGCHATKDAPPLPQRAYVWQRDWSAPVAAAIARSRDALAGFVVLGAEIEWKDNAPRAVRPRVDWAALRQSGRPVGIALRVAPTGTDFSPDDAIGRFIRQTARELIAAARSAGATPVELQLDFDCAQKKLASYGMWMRAVREAIKPVPLVITALPVWLDEPEFSKLVHESGRYVLQVHSIRSPKGDSSQTICDPELATNWVARADSIGVPFEIALPTYRYRAGYDASGEFIGLESDSVRPSWPANTRIREFATDAKAMARLVRTWSSVPPANCQGLIWYRLPVESDRNNWPLATLRAVMAGREPRASFSVRSNGAPVDQAPVQLADLSLLNEGETDAMPTDGVVVTWSGDSRAIVEALPGWSARCEPGRTRFSPVATGSSRLPPGAERAMGWLRLEPAASIHVEILP
jgi:hypothetical protein